MAYTTPRTWVANEVLLSTDLNTHVRDNIVYLKDEVVAIAGGDFIIARLPAEPAVVLGKVYHNTTSHRLFYCKEDA